jgi:hypothetical protein
MDRYRRLRGLWFHQTGKKQSIILLKVTSPSNVINDIDITDRRSLHYQKQD